jgi:hypothetical protein
MKIIIRFRWVFVAILLVALYFADGRRLPIPDTPYLLFLAALFGYAGLSRQLDRIERKVDEMAKAIPSQNAPVRLTKADGVEMQSATPHSLSFH